MKEFLFLLTSNLQSLIPSLWQIPILFLGPAEPEHKGSWLGNRGHNHYTGLLSAGQLFYISLVSSFSLSPLGLFAFLITFPSRPLAVPYSSKFMRKLRSSAGNFHIFPNCHIVLSSTCHLLLLFLSPQCSQPPYN